MAVEYNVSYYLIFTVNLGSACTHHSWWNSFSACIHRDPSPSCRDMQKSQGFTESRDLHSLAATPGALPPSHEICLKATILTLTCAGLGCKIIPGTSEPPQGLPCSHPLFLSTFRTLKHLLHSLHFPQFSSLKVWAKPLFFYSCSFTPTPTPGADPDWFLLVFVCFVFALKKKKKKQTFIYLAVLGFSCGVLITLSCGTVLGVQSPNQ